MLMILAAIAAAPVPATNPSSWITSDDYPEMAMDEGVEGEVGFRLTVANDGSPVDCIIMESSGSSELDESTCRLLLGRARFGPSDQTGSYQSRVVWKIPPPPKLPLSIAGAIAVTQLSDGLPIGSCQLESFGSVLKGELDLCELFEAEDGVPMLGIGQLTQSSILQVRLLIAPENIILPNSHVFSADAKSKLLVSARFNVDANGDPQQCQVDENNVGPEVDELCDEMISSGQQFDTAGVAQYPAKMLFRVDFTHE